MARYKAHRPLHSDLWGKKKKPSRRERNEWLWRQQHRND